MTTTNYYKVEVHRDEAGYWIADAIHVPGAHTFAKRIDQLIPAIREAIALALDVETDTLDTDIEFVLAPELNEAIDRVAKAREAANGAAREASEATRGAARFLVEDGVSFRDAGQLLGVSHQRIGQLVKG